MEDYKNMTSESVKPEPQVKKKHIVREYAESIIIAVILALIIRTFIVQAFKIPSGSMEDTLPSAIISWSASSFTVPKFLLPLQDC